MRTRAITRIGWSGILWCTMLVLPVRTAQCQDSLIDLRPNIEVGRDFRYVMEQRTKTRVGKTYQASIMKTDYLFRPQKVTSAGAVVDLEYEAASLILISGKRQAIYDTRLPRNQGDPELGQLLRAVVGKTLKLSLAPSGKVMKIRGLDAIRKAPGADLLRDAFDESNLKRALSTVIRPSLEKDRIRTGESWTVEQANRFDERSELKTKLRYRLTEVKGDIARITIIGKAVFRGLKDKVSPYRIGKQVIQGELLWNFRRRILEAYDLAFQIEILGKNADGSKLEMHVDQRSITTLQKNADSKKVR